MSERTWNMWAHRVDGTAHDGALWNVDSDRDVAGRRIHSMQTDQSIVRVFVTEWTGDQHADEVTHYAWELRDRSVPISITPRTRYQGASPTLFFEMGAADEIARGDGRMIALVIEERADDE